MLSGPQDKLKAPWADLKWDENGPLLTYADKVAEKDSFDYQKYLFAAKGVYKRTPPTHRATHSHVSI